MLSNRNIRAQPQQPVFQDLPSIEVLLTCFTQILNNQHVKEWTEYLTKCETNPAFLTILLDAFESQPEAVIRLQTLLLLVNVIKRNWSSARRSVCIVNLDSQKPLLRQRILTIYTSGKASNQQYKHIKDVLRFIARMDYPQNFLQLYHFFSSEVLQTVTKTAQKQILPPSSVMHLKLLKSIAKDQSAKRMYLEKTTFTNFNAEIVKNCFAVSITTNQVIFSQAKDGNLPSLEYLQLSRIVDRIILHLVQTINPDQQDNQEVGKILHVYLQKTKFLCELLHSLNSRKVPGEQSSLNTSLAKYLKSIIYYLGDVQHSYPFTFTHFLREYMQQLVQIFQANQFFYSVEPDIVKATMLSLGKLFKTFAYYADEESFSSSVMARNNRKDYRQAWKMCHDNFYAFFTQQTIENIFNSVLVDVYSYKVEFTEELLEEDDGGNSYDTPELDNHIHNIASNLLHKTIMRFKVQSSQLIAQLLDKLLASQFQGASEQICVNTFTMLIVLPKVYSQPEQLPLTQILAILEYLFSNKRHLRLFALIVGKYEEFFTSSQLQNCFNALVQLTIDPNSDTFTVFEASRAIKVIMQKRKEELQIVGLDQAVSAIINLFSKFDNPGIIWPLVTLVNNILDASDTNQEIVNSCVNNSALRQIAATKSQILVYPVCDLLTNLLMKSTRPQSLMDLIMEFLAENLPKDLENIQSIYQLWLDTAQAYSPEQDLQQTVKNKMLQLLQQYHDEAKQDHPVTFIRLVEEYVLLGFMTPEPQELITMIIDILMSNSGDFQAKSAAYSFFSTMLSLNQDLYDATFISTLITQLVDITDRQSVEISELRTNVVSIINRYLLSNPEKFLGIVQQNVMPYDQFFSTWLQNIQYLKSKHSSKLSSLTLIMLLQRLPPALFEQQLPKIIRIITNQLEPIQELRGFLSKRNISKTSHRKDALRKQDRFINLDMRPLLKEHFLAVANTYGLDEGKLSQAIPDVELRERLINALK